MDVKDLLKTKGTWYTVIANITDTSWLPGWGYGIETDLHIVARGTKEKSRHFCHNIAWAVLERNRKKSSAASLADETRIRKYCQGMFRTMCPFPLKRLQRYLECMNDVHKASRTTNVFRIEKLQMPTNTLKLHFKLIPSFNLLQFKCR